MVVLRDFNSSRVAALDICCTLESEIFVVRSFNNTTSASIFLERVSLLSKSSESFCSVAESLFSREDISSFLSSARAFLSAISFALLKEELFISSKSRFKRVIDSSLCKISLFKTEISPLIFAIFSVYSRILRLRSSISAVKRAKSAEFFSDCSSKPSSLDSISL